MLQLLEHLDKPLASLAILAGVLFTLAQTAKIVLSLAQTDEVPRILKLPEGMWQNAGRNSRPDIVCRLLTHGALSHLPNRDSHTPLDLARALSDPDLAALTEGETCLPAE